MNNNNRQFEIQPKYMRLTCVSVAGAWVAGAWVSSAYLAKAVLSTFNLR